MWLYTLPQVGAIKLDDRQPSGKLLCSVDILNVSLTLPEKQTIRSTCSQLLLNPCVLRLPTKFT